METKARLKINAKEKRCYGAYCRNSKLCMCVVQVPQVQNQVEFGLAF